jgi:TonB family protein
MTASVWLHDVGFVTLQLGALVFAGAAAWWLLRVRHSAATLAYWRVLLGICVLLPICQPRRIVEPSTIVTTVPAVVAPAFIVDDVHVPMKIAPAAPGWLTSEIVFAVLGGGVAVRGLWLLLGAFSLRRLRRNAVLLDPVPASIRAAAAKVGTCAAVYVSERVTSPITFGVRRPVVIVPPGVLEMDADLQEAIACHELVHVRRRDWLQVIAEELVRTVFWFHPAIWWLIGRIHLTREHVVDEAVIRLTSPFPTASSDPQSRARYVEAMVAVARLRSRVVPLPVPLFLKRRFLKKRVAHLLQETTMTTRRLIASATISAAALAFTSVLAVRAFPLEAQAPQRLAPKPAAAPVEIAHGGEHLLHGAPPEYPHRAVEQRIEGDVVLDLTIDDRGEVSDARVVSGPEALRRAALESVLQWHFSPEKLRSTAAQAVLRFTVPTEVALREATGLKDALVATLKTKEPDPREYTLTYRLPKDGADVLELEVPRTLERQLVEVTRALQESSLTASQRVEFMRKLEDVQHKMVEVRETHPEGLAMKIDKANLETLRLSRFSAERVSAELLTAIQERAGVKIGDQISEDVLKAIVAAAESVDQHFNVRWERDGKGGLIVVIIAP